MFLSATLTKKIMKELQEAGWADDTPIAVIQRASWPDQKIVRTTLANLMKRCVQMAFVNMQ